MFVSLFFHIFAAVMQLSDGLNYYYLSGVSAAVYLTTCWVFAAVRWFHTCREPKEHHDYLFPDRKLLVVIYLCASVLLPYVLNPASPSAWMLWKSYFPGTYYFYGGALFFCFFGTVKRWERWRKTVHFAAAITLAAMLPLVLNAWVPNGIMGADMTRIWCFVVAAVGVLMMGYCGVAMWQTLRWMRETRDENYSNPDDFSMQFARRVWLLPVVMTLMVWPPFLFDSPVLMAAMNLLLAVFNVVLLVFVLPAWRRQAIVVETEETVEEMAEETTTEATIEEREQKIIKEIEHFVRDEQGYLDAHLKLENVVAHCSYSRSYVSKVFQKHLGGFSHYVNSLRLSHYDRYMDEHPQATKETAAQESGFTSYNAYYKAKERVEEER